MENYLLYKPYSRTHSMLTCQGRAYWPSARVKVT